MIMPVANNLGSGADPALVASQSSPQAVSTKGFDPGEGAGSVRLSRAIAFAAQAHCGQVDKAGAPYILHPLRVMLAVDGEDAKIAAALHDVCEDCGIPVHRINEEFGLTVCLAVDALTRREGETYDTFIDRCGQNEIARRVKLQDLRDNSDLSRLPKVTQADRVRTNKYARSFDRLMALARIEARSDETRNAAQPVGQEPDQLQTPSPNPGDSPNV